MNIRDDYVYKTGANGELSVSASAGEQLPNVVCRLAWLHANGANTGKVYVGWNSSLTAPDGTTDTTTGIELTAGEKWGPLPIDNLNRLYRRGSVGTDRLTYFTMG